MFAKLGNKLLMLDTPPEMRLDLLAQYAANHAANMKNVPIACLVFGLVFAQWSPVSYVLGFIILGTLTSIAYGLACKKFLRARNAVHIGPKELKYWLLLIGVPRLLFILVWSSMIFWAWDPAIPETFIIAFIPIFGTMAINAATSGPFLPFYFLELTPKLAAVTIVNLMAGGVYFSVEIMVLVGTIFVIKIALSINSTAKKLLEQQYELEAAHEELHQKATTDELTGLHNRRFFMDKSKEILRAQRYKRPLSALLMDIDHFKSINDTYGHHVGDEVLRNIASVLEESLRETDVMARLVPPEKDGKEGSTEMKDSPSVKEENKKEHVDEHVDEHEIHDPVLGRIGGEEFALLLPETDAEGAYLVAERMRKLVNRTRVKTDDGQIIKMTVSVGITTLRHDDENENINSLLIRADEALYAAKEQGRNVVVPDSEARKQLH